MPNREVRAHASRFRGLNNTRDPRNLQIGWLTEARNVDIDDQGAIVRRPGLTQVDATPFRHGYATIDENVMYLATHTALYRMDRSNGIVHLYDGLDPSAPVRFLELNHQVYILNGPVHLVAEGDHVRQWGLPVPPQPKVERRDGTADPGAYELAVTYIAPDGRESGASPRVQVHSDTPCIWHLELPQREGLAVSVYMTPAGDSTLYRVLTTQRDVVEIDAAGIDMATSLATEYRQPPPAGDVLALHQGRVLIGDHFPEQRMSVVWQSDPLGYEHFQLDRAYIPVPNQVRMLAPTTAGLLIGTDREVLLWGVDEQLRRVFDYGVPPGTVAGSDDGQGVFFWTHRGLCVESGEGFQNVMREAFSPEASVSASAALVQMGGFRRVVALTQATGQPFNAWRKF